MGRIMTEIPPDTVRRDLATGAPVTAKLLLGVCFRIVAARSVMYVSI